MLEAWSFSAGVVDVELQAKAGIARDKDAARREISLSKVAKFQELKAPKLPDRAVLEAKFGPIRKPNDEVDVALLHALELNAVDFLITEDRGIHERVKLTPLSSRVFTVVDALVWLRRTFDPTPVALPLIADRHAYEIDKDDEIFDSLREGYPAFDKWWAKCVNEHRPCWIVTVDSELAGIIVRKDEARAEATVTLTYNDINQLRGWTKEQGTPIHLNDAPFVFIARCSDYISAPVVSLRGRLLIHAGAKTVKREQENDWRPVDFVIRNIPIRRGTEGQCSLVA